MKLADTFQSYSKREKLLLLIALSVAVGLFAYLNPKLFPEEQTDIQVVTTPQVSIPEKSTFSLVTTLASISTAEIKNPFLVPPEYREEKTVQQSSVSPNTEAKIPLSVHPKPVLGGIVSRGETRLVILELNGNSDIAKTGDTFGPYVVEAITNNQAVLTGPEGRFVLSLGR